MRLPTWFAPPKKTATPPTLDELRARLDAARTDHQSAAADVTSALAALESERTPEALTAVRTARERVSDLAELVGIVAGDVQRAEQAERDQRRAELERQRQAIGAELDALHERARGEAVDAEIAALIAVVDTRLARWALTDEIAAKHRELARIDVELGQEPRGYQLEPPHGVVVSERLEAMANSLPSSDPRRLMLRAVRPGREDYRRTGAMGVQSRTAEAAE